jgi:cobalt-zinc-cadmium efflux system outer membrane protein
LNLLFDVEVLFFDFAASLEAVRILDQNAEGAERILALTARRAELGEARETERIRAEVELLRLRRARSAAAQAVELARDTLRRLVGPGLPEQFEVEPVWPGAASVEELPTLRARMATRNPELLATRARAGESAEAAKASAWEAWPDLAASYYDLDEIDKTARGAKLGIRVPLWNASRAEAARQRAQASLHRAELRGREIDLEVELDRVYREYRLLAEQVDVYSKRLLPAAREGLRLTELTYEEGETSFLDLLDAQRTYREVAAELIGVRRDAARALAGIHRLTGGSDVADSR